MTPTSCPSCLMKLNRLISLYTVYVIMASSILPLVKAMSQNVDNSTSRLRRMTFVVNFDISSVICQVTPNSDDLRIFPISILCDGKQDCLQSPGMDDESFPYCSSKCSFKCGPNGTCLRDGGKNLCYCNDGFGGKGCDKPTFNECSNKPCHWLARCTNTFDSHYCTCLPGFEGDGYNCTDIDECATDLQGSKCPKHAKCCNIPGSHFCNCTEGFMPKGVPLVECVDIDECATGLASCPANTSCVNLPGSYECSLKACGAGHRLVDGKCQDIDECASKHDCDLRAECQNLPGSYQCQCKPGFSGDGKSCSPVARCKSQTSICHPDGYCARGLNTCVCRDGFIGDGVQCFDADECAATPSVCLPNQKCWNLKGSYMCCQANKSFEECQAAEGCAAPCGLNSECRSQKCVCKPGFVQDSAGFCSDFDECSGGQHSCKESEWCVNLEGSFVCCNSSSPLTSCQGLLIGFQSVTVSSSNNPTSAFTSTLPISYSSAPTLVTDFFPDVSTESSIKYGLLVGAFNASKLFLSRTSSSTEPTTVTEKPSTVTAFSTYADTSPLTIEKTTETSTLPSTSPEPESTTPTVPHTAEQTATLPLTEHIPVIIPNVTYSDSLPITSAAISTSPPQTSTEGPAPTTTSMPCSAERMRFCQLRRKACAVVNGESRCKGCIDGYFINEKGVCVESVSCVNATDCDKNSNCTNLKPYGHICTCLKGFIGDGHICDDIDECYSPNACSPNATCRNTIGSYVCTCKTGFFGDGRNCTAELSSVDETNCLKNASICHGFASCINGKCVCDEGFVGDGKCCRSAYTSEAPILSATSVSTPQSTAPLSTQAASETATVSKNESPTDHPEIAATVGCVLNPFLCDPNADCMKDQCRCRSGYFGDGLLCYPVGSGRRSSAVLQAPCASAGRACEPHERCIDGGGCRPFDCAAPLAPQCPANAACLGARCRCSPSFRARGPLCLPVLPPVVVAGTPPTAASAPTTSVPPLGGCQTSPDLCHKNARCFDNHCLCQEGYLGNGYNCVPDPNDCLIYPSICDPNAECHQRRRCACKPGFVGNGFTKCLAEAPQVKCGLPDSPACHRDADCLDQRCRCRAGFVGDGLWCAVNASDCSRLPSLCHVNAACTGSKCACLPGFYGDGYQCSASTISSNIDLSTTASILKQTPSCLTGHIKCHEKARCVEGQCRCQAGFSGNGVSCQASDDGQSNDCFTNPDLCDANASCFRRRCECNEHFTGNGLHCVADNGQTTARAASSRMDFNQLSSLSLVSSSDSSLSSSINPQTTDRKPISSLVLMTREPNDLKTAADTDSSIGTSTQSAVYQPTTLRTERITESPDSSAIFIGLTGDKKLGQNETGACSPAFARSCDKNSDCVLVGHAEECRCFSGFIGDGHSCDDINECSMRMAKCLPSATCVNTIGSYMCMCPAGQKGDGTTSCAPVTFDDSQPIDVQCEKDGMTLLLTNRTNFSGRIFVKTQSTNPKCSQQYNGSSGSVYKFTALFANCDIQMEDHNTFSTVVVVQKHPTFVTRGDEAFKLRCTYPAGEISLMSHYNVTMLQTASSLLDNAEQPSCGLVVTSVRSGSSITEATVGEQLRLQLSVTPQNAYGLVARNCLALNMENGESYQLTDSQGCALDASVFPEWRQENASQLLAEFSTFKWPDTSHIRFQCDCSPCRQRCAPVVCHGRTIYSRKKRSSTDDSVLRAGQVFSTVVQVKNSDSMLALEDPFEETDDVDVTEVDDLCVQTALVATALCISVLLVAITTILFHCGASRRPSQQDEQTRTTAGMRRHPAKRWGAVLPSCLYPNGVSRRA